MSRVSGQANLFTGAELAVRATSRALWCVTGVVTLLLLGLAGPAAAQSFDAAGTRAQGLGGAFVAVADDATATWWNPAGLAGGAFFSAVLERGQTRVPDDVPESGPATRIGTSGFAVTYPALGLSYYSFRVSERGQFEAIGAVEPVREDQGPGTPLVRSVSVSAFGATVGQSVGEHLVLASTVRLLRAGAVASTDAAGTDALDRIEDLSIDRDTKLDLDLGLMLRLGALHLGAAVKHVGEPEFGNERAAVVLRRQARAGVALRRGKTGVLDSFIGAVDLDLTTTPTVHGDERRMAAGAELGLARNRVALRGGLSASTTGDRHWQRSAGASVAVRNGLFVDGAITPEGSGPGASRAGWSVSLRTAF